VNRKALVSVPGKLILMGEHAAVYGQPALVAAIDPRARVEARLLRDGLQIELADFDLRLETSWDEARARADRSREAWRRYADQPTPERFSEVGSGTPADLAVVALGELAAVLAENHLPPMAIRVASSLPIGSGFGSSASIAVAILGAVLTLLRGSADLQVIDDLALEVERRQHGLPSGVDHKTVLYGGVVMAERRQDDSLQVTRLETRSTLLERLQVFQTGQPAETTGEVVAAVRRRRDSDTEIIERLFERMGKGVQRFRDQLVLADTGATEVNELFREYERCLEELGVVPQGVRETIREVEAEGGSSKISGAGALTGTAAGCLLVHWPAGEDTEKVRGLHGFDRQAVELGTEGLRVEDLQ